MELSLNRLLILYNSANVSCGFTLKKKSKKNTCIQGRFTLMNHCNVGCILVEDTNYGVLCYNSFKNAPRCTTMHINISPTARVNSLFIQGALRKFCLLTFSDCFSSAFLSHASTNISSSGKDLSLESPLAKCLLSIGTAREIHVIKTSQSLSGLMDGGFSAGAATRVKKKGFPLLGLFVIAI